MTLAELDQPPAYGKLAGLMMNQLKEAVNEDRILEPEAADKVTIGLALRRFTELDAVRDVDGATEIDDDRVRTLLDVLSVS